MRVKKVLSIAEIEKRYDSEWVLVGDPVTDASMDVRGGTILAHSKDRDEVYQVAVDLRPKRFALLYLGKLPKDAAIVL